jgi:hypothetical protein
MTRRFALFADCGCLLLRPLHDFCWDAATAVASGNVMSSKYVTGGDGNDAAGGKKEAWVLTNLRNMRSCPLNHTISLQKAKRHADAANLAVI